MDCLNGRCGSFHDECKDIAFMAPCLKNPDLPGCPEFDDHVLRCTLGEVDIWCLKCSHNIVRIILVNLIKALPVTESCLVSSKKSSLRVILVLKNVPFADHVSIALMIQQALAAINASNVNLASAVLLAWQVIVQCTINVKIVHFAFHVLKILPCRVVINVSHVSHV